jgi:hypothetical protein
MWFANYKRCRCIEKSKTKRDLPAFCQRHQNTIREIWRTHQQPSKERRRARYQKIKKNLAKHRQTSGYKEYQAGYHPDWVDRNREKWNQYQRAWRTKKRGYPVAPRFAPGKLKAIAEQYGVHPCTIQKWINKGELIIKKDYP